MRIVTFDTETWPIQPGNPAPRAVVYAFADSDGRNWLELPGEALRNRLGEFLVDPVTTVVAHNLSFDTAVTLAQFPDLASAFRVAGNAGRLRCTMLRDKLLALELGALTWDPVLKQRRVYSQAELEIRYLGRDRTHQKKDADAWRTRYCELDGVPLAQWPKPALDYALADARGVRDVFMAQGGLDLVSPNELDQVRNAVGLHLTSVWGMRTDPVAVDAFEADQRRVVREHRVELEAAGILDFRGRRQTKRILELVTDAYDGAPPMTDKGNVKGDAMTLKRSGDPLLVRLADAKAAMDGLSRDLPKLRAGTSVPCTPSIRTLLETGRCSYAHPNLQNLPRKGGARACFVPRPGFAFVSADFSQCELVCLAQICLDLFGFSVLGDAIREGKDVHCMVGAQIEGVHLVDFDRYGNPEHAAARQLAKVPNFALPGGMGTNTFLVNLRDNGYPHATYDMAQTLVNVWRSTWPCLVEFLAYVARLVANGRAPVTQPRSGRIRGGCSYTQAANTHFQGLAADLMFDAVWRIVMDSLCARPGDALHGARVVAVVHDEILAEVPLDRVTEAADAITERMLAAGERWTPDVPHSVDAVAMDRWLKSAERELDSDGRLVVQTAG